MFSTLTKRMPCTSTFLKWMLPRGLLAILIIVACILIIANSRRIETGIVEYKLITGENDGVVHVLLVNAGRRNFIITPKMKDIVSAGYDYNLIDHVLEAELHKHYTDIRYNVVMKLTGGDNMKSYVVPKEVFNIAQTDSPMKFEIDKPNSNRVRRVVTKEHVFALDTQGPAVNETMHYMYH